jgi:hypothetical protein
VPLAGGSLGIFTLTFFAALLGEVTRPHNLRRISLADSLMPAACRAQAVFGAVQVAAITWIALSDRFG